MRTRPAVWLALALAATAACNPPTPGRLSRPSRPASPSGGAPEPNATGGPGERGAGAEGVRPPTPASAPARAARSSDAVAAEAYRVRDGGPDEWAPGIPGFPSAGESLAPSMIIRTGTATVRVDSLEPALAEVRALAQRVGGYVANTTIQAGTAQYRQATLDVKVPAARFDDLLAGLRPLGKVESVNVTAEDVGEEFVDVSARVANARRLEERLIDLLATRTGRLQDVLNVERELARVRGEIERYEGRLRYLKSRAAMSTLSITVHEPLPIVDRPGSNPLLEALRQAWRNAVALLAFVIASLGIVVPLALAGGTVFVAVRRLRRPRPA